MAGGVHGGVCMEWCMCDRGCAWGACMTGSASWGVCMAWGCVWHKVCMAGVCVAGRHVWKGGCGWQGACMAGDMHGRRDSHCSRWYTTYWNAFL